MIINIIAETIIALCYCVFLDSNEDSDPKRAKSELEKGFSLVKMLIHHLQIL